MIDTKHGPMGTLNGAVQADETYHLNTSKRAKGYKKGLKNEASIVALVDDNPRGVVTVSALGILVTLYYCNECKGRFKVTVLAAIHRMHRTGGVTPARLI